MRIVFVKNHSDNRHSDIDRKISEYMICCCPYENSNVKKLLLRNYCIECCYFLNKITKKVNRRLLLSQQHPCSHLSMNHLKNRFLTDYSTSTFTKIPVPKGQ